MKSLYQNSRYNGLPSRFCNKICGSCEKEATSKEFIDAKDDYYDFLREEIDYAEDRLKCSNDVKDKRVFSKAIERSNENKNMRNRHHEALAVVLTKKEEQCLTERIQKATKIQALLNHPEKGPKTNDDLNEIISCFHPEKLEELQYCDAKTDVAKELLTANMEVASCPNYKQDSRYCDGDITPREESKKKKEESKEEEDCGCNDKPIARKDVKSEKVTSNKSVVVNNNDKVRTSSEKVTIYKTADGDLDLSKMDTETMSKAPETRSYLKYLVAKYVDRKDNLQDVFDTNEQFQWSDSKSGQLYRYKSGPDYNLSQREKALIPLAKFRAETDRLRGYISSLAEGNPNISADGDTVSFIDYSNATTPNKDSVESTRYEISFDDEGRAKYKTTQNFAGNFIQERFDDEFNYTLEEGGDLSEIKLTETGPRFDGRSDKTSTFNINSNFENKKTGRTQSGEKYVSGKLDTIYKALDRALKYSGDKVDPMFA
jgi:hypothetical protein